MEQLVEQTDFMSTQVEEKKNWALLLKEQVLPVTLFLYAIALLTSMAGMEIFSWTSAAIVIALFVRDLRRGKAWSGTGLPVDWVLLGLLWVIMIGAVFAAPPEPLGWGTTKIIGSGRFILLFFFLRLALHWTWTDDRVRKTMNVLIAIGFVVAIYAIVQHFTGIDLLRDSDRAVNKWGQRADGSWYYRAAGMFSSPLRYSYDAGMYLFFPLSICLLGATKTRWARYVMGLIAFVMVLSVIATLTRGAWIAVAAAVLVVGWLAGKRAFMAVLVGGAVMAGTAVLATPQLVERAESSVDVKVRSNSNRLDVWRANVEMFREHPLLGVGYGQNEPLITEYYEKLGITNDFGGHAHNNYLQFLSGTGVPGFLLYMFFVGYFFWLSSRLWRKIPIDRTWDRAFVLGAIGSQVVMHVGGLTECNFKHAEVNHLFMFMLAGLCVLAWRYREAGKLLGFLGPRSP